ncbi:MAG: DUF2842 domain-containing protein [Hyphomicrobiaceae bacterium]|nr:DUF2842 domain-containing protein [Hyphomicrobiaceae bacterium]
MHPRARKLIGAVLLLALIVIYAFLMIALAAVLEVHTSAKIFELVFYIVAGLGWVLPAAVIVRWMSGPTGTVPARAPVQG